MTNNPNRNLCGVWRFYSIHSRQGSLSIGLSRVKAATGVLWIAADSFSTEVLRILWVIPNG